MIIIVCSGWWGHELSVFYIYMGFLFCNFTYILKFPQKLYDFLLKIFFYWKITALQYCVSFCHTPAWIATGIHIPPPSWTAPLISIPIPPLWVVTECWLELPVSCSRFPLAIYFTYGNVYVSLLFSQFIPPSHSLTVSTSLFSMSVSSIRMC